MSEETVVREPEPIDGATTAQESTAIGTRGCRSSGLSQEVENYIVSLTFRIYIPLVPVVLEVWRWGEASAKTLTLAAALFGMGVGVASRRRSLFALTVGAGFTFIAAFGIIVGQQSELPLSRQLALLAILAIVVVYALERWDRHVTDCEPPFRWMP